MSFVPRYQWLTEYRDLRCGGCDKVYINGEATADFQVRFEPTVIIDEDFNGNNIADPMQIIPPISSGGVDVYGIIFNLDLTDSEHFVHSFSFFYDGVPYTYVFAMYSDPGLIFTPDYFVTDYGDFHLVKINTYHWTGPVRSLDPWGNYYRAFNAIMNEFGIVAIYGATPTLGLYGFPENTQVLHTPSSPTSFGLCNGSGDCSTWTLDNFIPVDNKVCFFQVEGLDGSPTNTASLQKEFVIAAQKRAIVTINYTNSLSGTTDINLIIKDNALSTLDTLTAEAESGTNTVTFSYDVGVLPPSSFFFEFQIESQESAIEDSMVGFCINSIKVETIDKLYEIAANMCPEDVEEDPTLNVLFEETYNDLYSSLITVDWGNAGITGAFALKLTDTAGNEWNSIIYQFISAIDCTYGDYMRFKWWSDCAFADIDYAGLPFVNDVYIQGYDVSQPIENKERVMNTLSSGDIEDVYNHSVEKREFNIGLYTELFYRTLERAFLHKYIELDSVGYTRDSDSKLTKKPENYKKFTAKIELIEEGTAVINSSCCCD